MSLISRLAGLIVDLTSTNPDLLVSDEEKAFFTEEARKLSLENDLLAFELEKKKKESEPVWSTVGYWTVNFRLKEEATIRVKHIFFLQEEKNKRRIITGSTVKIDNNGHVDFNPRDNHGNLKSFFKAHDSYINGIIPWINGLARAKSINEKYNDINFYPEYLEKNE